MELYNYQIKRGKSLRIINYPGKEEIFVWFFVGRTQSLLVLGTAEDMNLRGELQLAGRNLWSDAIF